jgi:response regulator RpfG family c-di-GMP phosphodiesterase
MSRSNLQARTLIPTDGFRNPVLEYSKMGRRSDSSRLLRQDPAERIAMNRILNVLLADDNPDDRSLVVRALSEEIPDCRCIQVTNLRQLSLALEGAPGDLVVTDYQLCWTDGLKVLKSVKSRWPECPVIMFTGLAARRSPCRR